jgi:hypothetical protein
MTSDEHQEQVRLLLLSDPMIQTHGFAKAVKKRFGITGLPRIIPDAYAIRDGAVDLYEVYVSWGFTIDKIFRLLEIKQILSEHNVDLRLFNIDMLGNKVQAECSHSAMLRGI